MSRWYWAALALLGGILTTWGMDYAEYFSCDAANGNALPAAVARTAD